MKQYRLGVIFQSVVDSPPYRDLSRQWWFALSTGVGVVIAGCSFLYYGCPVLSARQGSVQTALVVTYILYLLRRHLRLNTHGAHTQLRTTFGPANWITLARGGLIAFLAGFLLQPWPGRSEGIGWTAWIPGAVYIAAVGGDVLDGVVARATATQTQLGELLDTRIDALGILTACLLAVNYGQLPVYYISAGLAYYTLRSAVWLRKRSGRHCAKVRARRGARVMAAVQMVFLGLVLLPLPSLQATRIAAGVILIPFLAGFVLDWHGVCRHEKIVNVD